MAYIVIKTIKGRQYRYQQRTYREGGKVRTESIYLGPVGGTAKRKGLLRRLGEFVELNFKHQRFGLPDDEIMLRQYNEAIERERKARQEVLGQLHALYGMRLSDTPETPVDTDKKAPSEEGARAPSTPTPA